VVALPLAAVPKPETLILTTAFSLAGVETIVVAFLSLQGTDQLCFVQLSWLYVSLPGNGPDLGKIHLVPPVYDCKISLVVSVDLW